MKKLFLVIALFWSAVANANIIQISTDSVDVNPGDVVNYKIELIDFEAFDFLTFSLNYDDLLLTYDASSQLDGASIGVDFFGFSDLFIDDFFSGSLLISLNGFFSGTVYQGSFVLATFNFIANDSGTAFINADFGSFDSLGLGQSLSDSTPSIRTAKATQVSEPWALGLMLIGFAGLALNRKR